MKLLRFINRIKSILLHYPEIIKSSIYEYIGISTNIKQTVFGYKLFIDKNKYSIYKRNTIGRKIVAADGSVVVIQNSLFRANKLYIYPNFRNKYYRYVVNFDKKTFPGLIDNSKIISCHILPYMREVDSMHYVKKWRLVVITDKSQIYHNFPSRNYENEGFERAGDIKRFEESAVWDVPGRKHPVKTKSCDNTEIYIPCLPEEAYEYHPILNNDKNYIDIYGNGGFGKTTIVMREGKKIKVPRFYFPSRAEQANSFFYMGGYEPDIKISLIGTYQSNTDCGVRPIIFASSDGGRNWYAKYEFGDYGEYEFRQGNNAKWGYNHGNSINTSKVYDEYKKNSFSIVKRNLITPSSKNKEPFTYFQWDESVEISNISKEVTSIVTTSIEHKLSTGNIIAIRSNDSYKFDSWSWMLNNDISATSCGNGLLFKVVVIDSYRFKLYEYVSSPYNNISCRHIHHINRAKDGWIIGTGEIYPNGWLLFIQMKEADTFSIKKASDEFKVVRLNSSEKSVQRTLGMIMLDDDDTTLIFASDHDLLLRKKVKMVLDRSDNFERSSTGVFKGVLADIDNFKKYKVIYEAKEPAYFFKQLGSAYVFSGQRGELAISFDKGNTWHEERLDKALIYYLGKTYDYFVVGDYIIRFK